MRDGLPINEVFFSSNKSKYETWVYDYTNNLTFIKRDTVHSFPVYNLETYKGIVRKRFYKKYNDITVNSNEEGSGLTISKNNFGFGVHLWDAIKYMPPLANLLPKDFYIKDSLWLKYEISTNGKIFTVAYNSTLLIYDLYTKAISKIHLQVPIDNVPTKHDIHPQIFGDYFMYLSYEKHILRFVHIKTQEHNKLNLKDYHKEYKQSITHLSEDDTTFTITSDDNFFIQINKNLEVIDTFHWHERLQANNISKDLAGNYWISVDNDGLYVVSKYLLPFKITPNKFKGQRILNIYESNGYKFVFGEKSTLFVTTNDLGIIKEIKLPVLHKSYPSITKYWFYPTQDNGYYIASAFGIYLLDSQLNIESLKMKREEAFKDYVYIPSQKKMILGSNIGLLSFDSTHSIKLEGTHDDRHRTLNVTAYHNGYICTNNFGTILFYNHDFRLTKKISSKRNISFSTVYCDKLIALVEGLGIYCFDLKTKKICRIIDDQNFQKIKKGRNGIWVTNSKYVGLISLVDNKFKFTKKYLNLKGLLYDEVFDISECNNVNYLLCDKGIIKLPDSTFTYADKNFEKSVFLSSINIDGDNSYFFTIEDSIFTYGYSPSNITLQFTCNSTAFLGDIKYQYFIEGNNSSWASTDNGRVNIPNLSPGSYKLHIRATANNLDLNTSQKSFKIIVTPKWWQSFIFKLLLGILLVFIILYITYLRISWVKKREEQKTLMQSKISELELAALQSQMNPHFIFNSLTSIQGFIDIHKNEEADDLLQKFSSLIRFYLEFSRHPFVSIDKEKRALKLYTQIEEIRFHYKFETEIKVRNSSTVDLKNVHIPPMLIQPIVENAINHGLYHRMDSDGVLKVYIIVNDKNTTIVIDDNGIGRKQAKSLRDKILPPIGNKLIKERINVLNQSGRAKAEIQIFDKEDKQNNSNGTRVILRITNILNYDKRNSS